MIKKASLVVAFALIFAASCVATAADGIIPRLNAGESLNVTAIGTSLTSANGPSQWFEQAGGWLQSLHPGKVSLSNRAVGASASSTTNPRGGFLQLNDVLTYDSPDAIFIEFSINDAYTAYGISLQQSKDNLQTMINTTNAWAASHNKNVDIIVCTMSNCIGFYSEVRPDLADYYQGYRDVAAANNLLRVDNHLNWVNLYESDRPTWDSYVPDGLHPNYLGGTNVILPEVQSALMSQVPEPSALALLTIAAFAGLVGWFVRGRRHRG